MFAKVGRIFAQHDKSFKLAIGKPESACLPIDIRNAFAVFMSALENGRLLRFALQFTMRVVARAGAEELIGATGANHESLAA